MAEAAIPSLQKTWEKTACLLAAAALMIDDIPNAAASIPAVAVPHSPSGFSTHPRPLSAYPCHPHTHQHAGTKDGFHFMNPFSSLLIVIIAVAIAVLAHGHPTPVVSPPTLRSALCYCSG